MVSPTRRDRDEVGILYPSVDDAYLEAHRAAVEISRDLLLRSGGGDPNIYRFEIFDRDRNLVLEVPFREVLNPGAGARVRPMEGVMESLHRNLARSRALKAELAVQLAEARRCAGSMSNRLAKAAAG
jgi:hypothetical protein